MNIIKIFLIFFKIGLISFGGGYGMILVMKKELMKYKMIEEKDFMDSLVLAQSAPGALAINLSIVVAKKIGGYITVMAAFIGVILPSFLIILFLSNIFAKIRHNPLVDKFMQGTKPAVLALIVGSFLNLFKNYQKSYIGIILIIATLILTAVLKIHPILILLIVGVIGYFSKSLR